jgi:hypothetical protein
MDTSSPQYNSRRYEADRIDLIIPFLINQHVPYNNRKESPPPQPKKYSATSKRVLSRAEEELAHIAKIYNIPKKKSTHRQRFINRLDAKVK